MQGDFGDPRDASTAWEGEKGLTTMLKMMCAAGMLAAAVGMGSAAHADTQVQFAGSGGLADHYTFTLDRGATLTVTAGAYDRGVLEDAQVGQYAQGLGVTNQGSDTKALLDGQGRDDALFLRFSKPVRLTSMSFAYVNRWDDVQLTDGAGVVRRDVDLGDFKIGSLATVALDEAGQVFGIRAKSGNDEVALVGVTYTVIPSPAAAGLGVMGLLGLVARRRRPALG